MEKKTQELQLKEDIKKISEQLEQIRIKLNDTNLNVEDVYSLTLAFTNLYQTLQNIKAQLRFQLLMFNN